MADNPSNTGDLLDTIKQFGLESLGVYYGNYRGVVADVEDPEKLGRVKLRVPQIAGDNVIEEWAWPKGQVAGEDFGDFMIPPKGSPVWVEFENGDPQHPIWSGGHWARKNGVVPEEAKILGGKNRVRKSEKWVIEMNDEETEFRIKDKEGERFIEITPAGIKLSSNGKTVEIGAGGVIIEGKAFLTHVHTNVEPGGGVSGGVQ